MSKDAGFSPTTTQSNLQFLPSLTNSKMEVIAESKYQEKEDSDNEENEIVNVCYNDKIV